MLLPISGKALKAKFWGPNTIDNKVSHVDYSICTPDRRKQENVSCEHA